MAPTTTRPSLTISQLERLLRKRRADLDSLMRERVQITKRLAAVDGRIRALSGGDITGGGLGVTRSGRARNAMSLVATMSEVLSKAGKPLNVGDIVDKVQASGYHSNAANFRALVNQTLIKQRKLFSNAGRGMYEVNARK
jgi:hypothetical protein